MSTRTRRRLIAIAIVISAAVVATADPGMPNFHATPEVRVIQVSGSGGGTVVLTNDTPDSVHVQSITRDISCDSEVTHGVQPPFDVAAGSNRPITVNCMGASGFTGMKRCLFHVNDTAGPPLLDFEGVCEYAAMPTLSPSITTHNFGTVSVGGEASVTLQVTNLSPTTITRLFFQTTDIDGNFEIGAPCSGDARECDATVGGIGQGSGSNVTVWCRPTSGGTMTTQLHIATNTNQYLSSVINLTCNGTSAPGPVFSLTGSPADAGSIGVTAGTSPATVRIRNAGGQTLTIKSVSIVNGAALDWSYTASGPCTGQIPNPAFCDLTANQEVTLGLTFDPSTFGPRNATLLIDYFDTADRSTTVPLRGTGLAATMGLVGGSTAIDFGVVPIGVASPVTFDLANQGNISLTDVQLSAVPAGPPFSSSPASPVTIVPNIDRTITATCMPTAAGVFTTTLRATSATAFMSSPIMIAATCEGTTMSLYSNPTTISRGELRTGTTPPSTMLDLLGATPLTITSIALESANPNLTLVATPGATPLQVELRITPTMNGSLANAILVTASGNNMLRIPISGQIVTATYTAPPLTSLGTFCVDQPTTPSLLSLDSTGTASIRLTAPRMALDPSSPFDLAPITPTMYPATLVAGAEAVLEVSPKRQAFPGTQQDDVIWTTDVASMLTARTTLSATFVDDGGAVAPSGLDFGQVTVHVSTNNAQSITLQNCDTTPIELGDPTLPAPFTIDSGTFPLTLQPNESTTIAVGFHPARVGMFGGTMAIPSEQLLAPLEVKLMGEGVNTGGDGDGGPDDKGFDQRSFYGCGCSTQRPSTGLAISSALLAVAVILILRRRRRPNDPND